MDLRKRLLALQASDTGAVRSRRLILGAIVLLALGLRLLRLNFQPLWWDEGWSLYFATADPGSMLRLTAVDIHPPLYYALLHVWTGLFGASPIAVRLLSVLIGVATVPVLYLTGRRLLGETTGRLASFLLAISPFAIYYSQEVRMYGLAALLGLAAFYFALDMQARSRSLTGTAETLQPAGGPEAQSLPANRQRRFRQAISWLGYVVAATAALYTQYYAAFLLLALNLMVLARWLRHRPPLRAWLAWLAAQLAVVALYVPWLWYAAGRLLTYVRYKVVVEEDVPVGFLTYLARHLAALDWGHAEGALAPWWWVGMVPLAVLGLALATALWLRRGGIGQAGNQKRRSTQIRGLVSAPSVPEFRRPAMGACAWIVAVLLLSGFAVNVVFPFNAPRIERQLLLALPFYLLVFSAAVLWLRQRRALALVPLASLLVLGLLSLGFFYTVPRYPDDDYRPVANRIRAAGQPTDAILAIHPWQVGYFESYLPEDTRPALVLSPREVLPRERQFWADDPTRLSADLDALLAAHGRIWFPAHQSMGRVLEDKVEDYLARQSYLALSEWYGENTVLSLFASGAPVAQPVTAQFGDWLSLELVALGPDSLEAGWGVLPVELTWQLSRRPAESYTVGLRLVDAAGRVWAQRDAGPVGGREPFSEWPVGEARSDRHGLLVPAGTPPGEYRVTARVYRSDDLSVLPATFQGGSGGEVTLGKVRVVRPGIAPPVEALTIGDRRKADFDQVLRLLGFSTQLASPLLPGEAVEVDLFWQALRDPGEDYYPRLQLVGSDGAILAELAEKPVAGSYPTAWWKSGELVRDPHALPIPATAPAGRYRLVLSLVRAADGSAVEISSGRTSVDLLELQVQTREHHYEFTMPQNEQEATFGRSVEFTGYDLAEAARQPGTPLEVTLHWHALATPDKNYHTFVHLLDANQVIVAQDDGLPGGGELPPLGWLPGEYLTDTHVLQLPSGLPDGEYRLEVGLYDPVSGERPGEPVVLDLPVLIRGKAASTPASPA